MGVTTYTTVNGKILSENRNGVKTLFMPDTLGSVIETRNMDTGNQTSSTTYWPYGEIRNQTGTNPSPWGYCGTWGYYTKAGLPTYVRARDYEEALGRWQAVDPLWPTTPSYIYSNEPLVEIDQFGMQVTIHPSDSRNLWPPKSNIWDIPGAKGRVENAAKSAYVGAVINIEFAMRQKWCLRCAQTAREHSDAAVSRAMRQLFPPGMSGGGDTPLNAVMHCTSACYGLLQCGRAVAEEYYNDIYEGRALGGNESDRHNNRHGFDCGEEMYGPGLTPFNCANCCLAKYRDGKLKWH